MNNQTPSSGTLLRNVGFVGIAVGFAWALQVLGVKSGSPFDNLAWLLGAASLAGASVGLILISGSVDDQTAEA